MLFPNTFSQRCLDLYSLFTENVDCSYLRRIKESKTRIHRQQPNNQKKCASNYSVYFIDVEKQNEKDVFCVFDPLIS